LASADADTEFARLVSLACHDLRTPLATVHGFARTLARMDDLGEPASQYVTMLESASGQIADLLAELSLAARIEAGRYEPALQPIDTLDLARAAAETLGAERVAVDGAGGPARCDAKNAPRSFTSLVQCALRHGGLDQVEVVAEPATLTVAPITPASAPVVLGEDLRDLGAAVAARAIRAAGGSVAVEGTALRVSLPS
jgi:signal transduction histidine kinase